MAKGRISKTEKYCIEKMHADGESNETIAEFLGRSVSSVESHIPQKTEKPETNHQKQKKKNNTLFIRKTAGKNEKAVSIMTPEESSRGDDTSAKSRSKITNRYESVIHTISEEDEDG